MSSKEPDTNKCYVYFPFGSFSMQKKITMLCFSTFFHLLETHIYFSQFYSNINANFNILDYAHCTLQFSALIENTFLKTIHENDFVLKVLYSRHGFHEKSHNDNRCLYID